MGVPIEETNIKARAANKQSLEIQGVSKGIYIRFPNVSKTFFVKPLIVKNLSCKLNLGAQFNHQTGFIPQKVISGSTGKKTNFSELDGICICLHFQDVMNRTLRSLVGDSEFVLWLQKEPPKQRRGVEDSPPHTLHVIQQEKPRKKEPKEMLVQTSRQEEEDPELERLVNQARLTATA